SSVVHVKPSLLASSTQSFGAPSAASARARIVYSATSIAFPEPRSYCSAMLPQVYPMSSSSAMFNVALPLLAVTFRRQNLWSPALLKLNSRRSPFDHPVSPVTESATDQLSPSSLYSSVQSFGAPSAASCLARTAYCVGATPTLISVFVPNR